MPISHGAGNTKMMLPLWSLMVPTVQRGSRVSIAAPMKEELREIGGVSYADQCNTDFQISCQ